MAAVLLRAHNYTACQIQGPLLYENAADGDTSIHRESDRKVADQHQGEDIAEVQQEPCWMKVEILLVIPKYLAHMQAGGKIAD